MWANIGFERGDIVVYNGRKFLVQRVEDGIALLLNDESETIRVACDQITDVYFD